MGQLAGTKYQIVRELGAGGMGVVYQVVKPPNIQGVLKLMSSELTRHEDLRVRFFDEVRILAQLDHPNIVRVFDYDQLPDGTPYYVMELLNGRTVRDVLGTVDRVSPRVAFEITRQLLEALHAAHTNDIPVVHRDIKPENIFLHAPRHGDPVVKLIDFGVSSLGDRKHDDTFVGTWAYAAPEQIRGERPTAATDLYAVGLVLYEMLAGRGPFDHHRDWKMLSLAQIEEIPAPVSQFAPWVPESIVHLIAQALAKDPRQRPRDAHAFAEKLYELQWAEGPSVPTQPGHPALPSAPLTQMLTEIHAARGEAPVIGAPIVVIPTPARPNDTFASSHSRDAYPAAASPRSRTILYVLAAAIVVLGMLVAGTILVLGRQHPTAATTAATTAPPLPESPAVAALPPAKEQAVTSASSAPSASAVSATASPAASASSSARPLAKPSSGPGPGPTSSPSPVQHRPDFATDL